MSLNKTEEEKMHREGHVKAEAETGVRQPQNQERQQPTKAGRGEEDFFPRAFRGQHFDFRLLVSRMVRKHIRVILSHPVCSHVSAARRN